MSTLLYFIHYDGLRFYMPLIKRIFIDRLMVVCRAECIISWTTLQLYLVCFYRTP